jgi:alpha-1,2-mannosyltransferase
VAIHGHVNEVTVATVLALAIFAGAAVGCLLRPGLRLPVVLMAGTTILLMTTPVWFFHYTALTAAPAALLLGSAGSIVLDWLRSRKGKQAVVAASAAASLALLAVSYPLIHKKLDQPFPGESLQAAVAGESGCITTDWPTALIQMNMLSRNIERGCRFEVDLGGWSLHLGSKALRRMPRTQNVVWQQFVLDYLRSGDATLIIRFKGSGALGTTGTKTYRSWPRIYHVGVYVLREPLP